MTPEEEELVCAWVEYRKDHSIPADDLAVAHLAFEAGWKAAREGDQSGPLR
jgi:hypothetical protein